MNRGAIPIVRRRSSWKKARVALGLLIGVLLGFAVTATSTASPIHNSGSPTTTTEATPISLNDDFLDSPLAEPLSPSIGTSEDPVWYEFYIVGMETDDSDVIVDPDSTSIDPGSVTKSMVEEMVSRVDDYFKGNSNGAIRARLAKWVPFAPYPIDVCDSNGEIVFDEAERRAGVSASATNVVVAATNGKCPPHAGLAGVHEVWLFGHLRTSTLGHEFGHSHLGLDHEAFSTCGYVDALNRCTNYAQQGFIPYWGTSIMSSSDRLDPLLPTDLERIHLLDASNTVNFDQPPSVPVDVSIGDLPISSGAKVIRLGKGFDAMYVSRSASTNFMGTEPIVQVTQTPGAFSIGLGTMGLTIVSHAGAAIETGKVHCGDLGFCIQVLSQSGNGAVVRVSSRLTPIPAAPDSIRANIDSEGFVRVDWDAPSDPPEIQGYSIQIINAASDYEDIRFQRVGPSATSWTYRDHFGRTQFRVAAETSNGVSDYSPATTVIDNRQVPGAPVLSMRPGTLGTAQIGGSCDPHGSHVVEMRYRYTDDPRQPDDRWATSTTGRLTGLTPHVDYIVKGQCRNLSGWGPEGELTFSVPGVPRAPAMSQWDVDFTPAGLTFFAGPSDDTGHIDLATGVRVTLTPGGAGCENRASPHSGVPTTCTVSGLPPGKQFSATVVLTNDQGASDPQVMQVGTEVRPPTVSGLRVDIDGARRAIARWDAVTDLYLNPTVHYSVQVEDQEACDTTGTHCYLPSLEAGRSHLVSVVARTLGGISLPSTMVFEPRTTTSKPPREAPGSGGQPKDDPTEAGPSGKSASKRQAMRGLPKKVRVGRKVTLPKRSRQGVSVRWSGKTPKTCGVKRKHLMGRKTGVCRIIGMAQPIEGYRKTTWRLKITVRR